MQNSSSNKFSGLSIAVHWLTLLLLVGVYATMEFRDFFPKGSDPRAAMKTWHYLLGLSVFALVWIRLAARWLYTPPPLPQPAPEWQKYSAAVIHAALYAFMICMPLTGWILLGMEGKSVTILGLHLPALVDANPALSEIMEELHETVAVAGYALIGLHTVAALFHHFAMHDDTLRRMSPFNR